VQKKSDLTVSALSSQYRNANKIDFLVSAYLVVAFMASFLIQMFGTIQ
jgi:hypothetical protein